MYKSWWAYTSHIIVWFLSGGLFVMAMDAVDHRNWLLVGIGFTGAALLAWAAQWQARQVGYVKAMDEAFKEPAERGMRQS